MVGGSWGLVSVRLACVTFHRGVYKQQASFLSLEAASPRPWSWRLCRVGRARFLLRGWLAVFSPRPHRAEGTRMPFMGAPHSRPDHLPKAPPRNTTSEGRFKIQILGTHALRVPSGADVVWPEVARPCLAVCSGSGRVAWAGDAGIKPRS